MPVGARTKATSSSPPPKPIAIATGPKHNFDSFSFAAAQASSSAREISPPYSPRTIVVETDMMPDVPIGTILSDGPYNTLYRGAPSKMLSVPLPRLPAEYLDPDHGGLITQALTPEIINKMRRKQARYIAKRQAEESAGNDSTGEEVQTSDANTSGKTA